MTSMPYGARDGKLFSVHEVQRGLACGCFCPACGCKLVAKKGPYRDAYFAHFDSKECPGWLETVVHQRAKTLLAEDKKITLPPVYRVPGECIYPYTTVIFEEVYLEVTIGNGRADAIGILGGRPVAIEIAVTHKISEDRIFEYRALGHAAVEVDIHPPENFNDDTIRSILTRCQLDRRWICNQHIESSKLWKLGQKDYSLNSLKLRREYYAY